MTNFEMAKNNYGRTWTAEMLVKLVEKEKLTAEQYKEITGFTYPATKAEK